MGLGLWLTGPALSAQEPPPPPPISSSAATSGQGTSSSETEKNTPFHHPEVEPAPKVWIPDPPPPVPHSEHNAGEVDQTPRRRIPLPRNVETPAESPTVVSTTSSQVSTPAATPASTPAPDQTWVKTPASLPPRATLANLDDPRPANSLRATLSPDAMAQATPSSALGFSEGSSATEATPPPASLAQTPAAAGTSSAPVVQQISYGLIPPPPPPTTLPPPVLGGPGKAVVPVSDTLVSSAPVENPAPAPTPPGPVGFAPFGPVEPAEAFQANQPGPLAGNNPEEEAQEATQIQLTPPGPEVVFRRESEANLQVRMQQEARSRPVPERIDFPEEPVLSKERYAGRAFPPLQEVVEPSYVCYRRLYFEDINSERYGWDLGFIQPFVSTGIFFYDVLALPYHMGTEICRHYECSSGYCLPGDPVPYLLYPPELSLTGAVLEAGVIAAGFAIFPG
ncbi:MAG: hypothetical protein JO112_11630 [Planctomycetes bacterium]|nr:hypothetical protein [Planctomycetota bacterium]